MSLLACGLITEDLVFGVTAMGKRRKKNENIIRKDIWHEDLQRELEEHLANGFDLRGIKAIRNCSRREGEPEQYFYRVTFEKTSEVMPERESAGVK